MSGFNFPRVLSVQSHVVSGHVGNTSACFPLQLLGFEVEVINSVQFSNHTGYPVVKGQILNADDLKTLFDGIKQNNLHKDYAYILTGYVHSLSFMQSLYDIISELKSTNKDLKYLCDPVMGDDGNMYVPDELLPFYRDKMISLADILVPNQFEAELLTGVTIVDQATAMQAIDILHEKGIPVVIISSSRLSPCQDKISVFASRVSQGGVKEAFKCQISEIAAHFTGTGDVTAALLLAWLHKTDWNLSESLCKSMSSLQVILQRTVEYASSADGGLTPKNLELKLVQSKRDIECPPDLVTCVRL